MLSSQIKKILMLFVLLISCLSTSAQIKPVYFYGDQVTQEKDRATSYAIYGKISTENVWTFKRYDLYDNLLQTGSYSDETLTVAHGKFIFYSDVNQFNNTYLSNFALKGKTRFKSQEGDFEYGKEQGKWIMYFPDGNILSAFSFVDGLLHGELLAYDRYGRITISGNYVKGEKDGEWLVDKGKVREIWEMGVLKLREDVKKSKTVRGNVANKN